jgi:hypothetical protein
MRFDYTKATFAVWFLTVCALGFAVDVKSVAGWTILLGLALLPPMFTWWLWSEPQETMSETIQKARR